MTVPSLRAIARFAILLAAAITAPSVLAANRSHALIDEVTRVAGGLHAARALPALAYHLHIKEASFEVDAVYAIDRGGRMRIDIYNQGRRVLTECYDGARAWQMDGDGKTADEGPDGAAALWHGTQYPGQILALAELPALGHRVESVGRERIGGAEYIVLKLTMRDGFETYRYVDTRTKRIERSRDVRAPHPDLDPKKTLLETTFSDFRRVDGVLRPFRETQTDLKTGKWNQTVTVQSVRRLPSLADALFAKGSPPDPSL